MATVASETNSPARLVEAFKAAALAYYAGVEIANNKAQSKAISEVQRICKVLDALRPGGRAELAVLLDNPDQRVRAMAAGYLINTLRDRVLPILQEIEDAKIGEATMTAAWILFRDKHGGVNV